MGEDNTIFYSKELEEIIKKELGKDASPELLNLVRAAVATHEHAFAQYGITKEKYLEFISKAWDAEIYQRKVYDREEEGPVNNAISVAMGFASNLAMFGKREVISSKRKNPKSKNKSFGFYFLARIPIGHNIWLKRSFCEAKIWGNSLQDSPLNYCYTVQTKQGKVRAQSGTNDSEQVAMAQNLGGKKRALIFSFAKCQLPLL